MAEEITIPVWRQALTERENPLYEAAWIIFSMNSVEYGASYLADEKDDVIPLMKIVLEDDDLYANDAFGGGHAPVNVIRLIGEWQLNDFLPTLLEILGDTPEHRPAYNAALNAVMNMGSDVIEPVLEWVADDATLRIEAAKVLARVGRGNDKVFDTIAEWIDHEDTHTLYVYTGYLIDLNPSRAERIIYELSRDKELGKEDRNRLKGMVNTARQRAQQLKELEATAEAAAEEIVDAQATLESSEAPPDAETEVAAEATGNPDDTEATDAAATEDAD